MRIYPHRRSPRSQMADTPSTFDIHGFTEKKSSKNKMRIVAATHLYEPSSHGPNLLEKQRRRLAWHITA